MPDYESLGVEIRNCWSCCFRDRDFQPLAPLSVHVAVPIMFVGENPSWQEGQTVPFDLGTISGKALDENYLTPLGLDRSQVWITDLFKCRYPKHIHAAKPRHHQTIQNVAETCARLWLTKEIQLAQPKILVTLSDKEVFQRLRRAFTLNVPSDFARAVGKPHRINLAGHSLVLFPAIHPDISRPVRPDSDKRKLIARTKWATLHANEHIPILKELLKTVGES